MFFGIPLTPFNVINFAILAMTALMAWVRYARPITSNGPLIYWAAVITHLRFFEGGFNPWWIGAGAACALFVRFEFMSHGFARVFLAGEAIALGYVVWRTLGLILLW